MTPVLPGLLSSTGRTDRPAGASPAGPTPAVLAGGAAGWLAVAGAIVLGVSAWGPLALVGGAAVALALLLLVTRPTSGVLVAVFLLFTNLPVVAAQDGLVPRAAGALVGLLFLPALAHHLIVRRREARVDRTFGLLVAFLGALVVSALVAVDPGLALERIGIFAMEGLAVYFLVLNTVRDLPALRRVMAVLVGAAALLAALAAFQAGLGAYDRDYGGLARLHPEVEEGLVDPGAEVRAESRARGPVDDPNRFAQILLLVAPLAFVLARTAEGRTSRGLAAAAGLLILGAILLTYSRGAFLTLAVLVVLLGVLRYVRPSRIVAAVLVASLLVPVVAPGYVERVRSIAGVAGLFSGSAPVEPDAVTRGRTTEMLAAVLAFLEHPVVGVGPGQYMPHYSVQYQLRPEISFRELPTPRRAHDLYVEIAAETGAVGILIFLAIPALLLVELWRIRRRTAGRRPDLDLLAGGFVLAILGYLGTGVFLHLAYERYYWFFLALTGAAVRILRDEDREEASPRPVSPRRESPRSAAPLRGSPRRKSLRPGSLRPGSLRRESPCPR